jgi:hypothetical protein
MNELQINYKLYFRLITPSLFNDQKNILHFYHYSCPVDELPDPILAFCSETDNSYEMLLYKYMHIKKKEYNCYYYNDKINLIRKRIEQMNKIKKELIIYLSQPKYLIKYLEGGNSVEDYIDQF